MKKKIKTKITYLSDLEGFDRFKIIESNCDCIFSKHFALEIIELDEVCNGHYPYGSDDIYVGIDYTVIKI